MFLLFILISLTNSIDCHATIDMCKDTCSENYNVFACKSCVEILGRDCFNWQLNMTICYSGFSSFGACWCDGSHANDACWSREFARVDLNCVCDENNCIAMSFGSICCRVGQSSTCSCDS